MKFSLTDLSGFSSVGTIVYYPERRFYSENAKNVESSYLQNDCRASSYLYSTSLVSEYVDFAKSGFSFTGNYQEELIPNLFDYDDTLSLLGGNPEFDDIVSTSFPGLSVSEHNQEKHFFGQLESIETTYIAHLPKGTWKVEIYNSKISGNCSFGGFIDYDILEKFHKDKILEVPYLVIYFGPGYDVSIQDSTFEELGEMYLNRYLGLTKVEYDRFSKRISRKEYIENYREEVQSEKILYILSSPIREIKEINFYPISYPKSKNPHPHMSEEVLRNDCLWSSQPNIIDNPSPGVIIDSRSDTLLGLKSLTEKESPWFHEAISANWDYEKINGKIWKNGEDSDKIIRGNPEISPQWYCEEDFPETRFKYFYVTSKGGGKISPSGLIYLGPEKSLKFKVDPDDHYEYSGVENVVDSHIKLEGRDLSIENPESFYKNGYTFKVIFNEIVYSLNLQIECKQDFYRNTGLKSTYNLLETGGSLGSNYWPIQKADIKLIYLTEYGYEEVFGNSGSTYNKLNLPKVSDSKKLYFRLDLSESPYEMTKNLIYSNGKDVKVETIDGVDWYVLEVKDKNFPDLGSNRSIIPIGEISSKRYTVSIKTSTGVQISTPKVNIMEYHNIDPNSSDPAPRPFITKMILDGDKTIEVKRYRNGVEIKDYGDTWSFTKESDMVWVLEIPSIESDYEIIIT